MQAIHDRWAIEQGFADLKEVEAIEQVQLRRVWSNVGALNLNLWVHTLVEVWAWGRPAEEVRDRRDRLWDDPDRCPSHADCRRALQRAMVEEEFQRVRLPLPWSEKIRPMGGRRDQDGGLTQVATGKEQIASDDHRNGICGFRDLTDQRAKNVKSSERSVPGITRFPGSAT